MFKVKGKTAVNLSAIGVAFLLAAMLALGFTQPALAELAAGELDSGETEDEGTSSTTSVLYLPGVTAEMTNALYWIDKQENPSEILADRATIDKLNQAGIDADGTMLQPLKTANERFYDADEQKSLKNSAADELTFSFVGKVYDEDDVLLTLEYANQILANYPTGGTAPNIASGYAIVTTHTTMRAYPTDKALMYTKGDYDDDNLYLSALRVNEPLLVRAQSVDGKFLLCISSCMQTSWVPTKDVAICKDRDEWLKAWDIPAGQELVVTGYKVRTEQSRVTANTANRMLYMGTVLQRVDWDDPSELVGTRSVYNNHVCYLPVRNDDGTYSRELALIAESEDVSEGYLPLTKANIATVALRSLGQMYGWGGMLEANDCSGYVRDVYKCFGLELARNTTWQMNMPVRKYDLSGLDDAHKSAAIAQMPLGTALYWSGHAMIYLGQENGKLYVISATGAIGNLFGESGTAQVKGVIINTLDMVRGDRTTWLQTLTTAIVPYAAQSDSDPGVYDIVFYDGSITWPEESYEYTGEAIQPTVEVPGLTVGEDYTVAYANNVEPGTATVTVTGAGSYKGSASRTFLVEEGQAPDPGSGTDPDPDQEEDVTYQVASGNGATWTRGSTTTLDFTFKRSVDDDLTYDLFSGLTIDGVAVDAANYTTEAGSLIVKLNPAYLGKLSAGSHSLVVKFNDGSATAKFTVAAKSSTASNATTTSTVVRTQATTPRTGDVLSVVLPVVLVLVVVGLVGIGVSLWMRKRTR